MSKAPRTVRRFVAKIKKSEPLIRQQSLDEFTSFDLPTGKTTGHHVHAHHLSQSEPASIASSPMSSPAVTQSPSPAPTEHRTEHPRGLVSPFVAATRRPRSDSVLSGESNNDVPIQALPDALSRLDVILDSEEDSDASDDPGDEVQEQIGEEWEEELDEMLDGSGSPRSWKDLRQKCIQTLQKQHKTLSHAQINQFVILRNFATLRIRGYGRIEASEQISLQWRDGAGTHFARQVRALARHYQIFETLPKERRGGARAGTTTGLSLLLHEGVEARTRSWLTAQPSGSVTPTQLAHALENEIFPDLQITPLKPLTPQTARRWLLRLGWRHTTVRKGVYKDGHNREDVVQYRQEIFLPKLATFEACMTKFEGPELTRKDPVLSEGQKRIIPIFHDECCFHAHDAIASAW
jgi:hypothetical protein